jgi:hypothetical protein
VKGALLTSFVDAFAASLARTRAWFVGEPGTVHEKVPADAVVAEDIVLHVEPLFVESSSLTFVNPFCVQVIACEDPAYQSSPPFGDVTVTEGAGTIVKVALLTSFVAAFAASLILTDASEVGVGGTVHEYVPDAAGVLAMTPVHAEPLFVEYSIFTFATPVDDHHTA